MEGIKIREIKWHPKTKKISQIPNEGLEYALVSDDYEQVGQLVWCKDFMQDAIHGRLNNSFTKIYGFVYDPDNSPPISVNRTRLMVTNWKDKELESKITQGVLPLLHEVEDKLKMSKTVLEKCDKVPHRYMRSGVWLFDSSIRWSKAPPMISLFTMLIRIGLVKNPTDDLMTHIRKIINGDVKCYYSVEKMQDKTQVEEAESAIKTILKHGDRRLFHKDIKDNYPPLSHEKGKYISIYTIHDNCGIGSFAEGRTKELFPHWHRFDKGKK